MIILGKLHPGFLLYYFSCLADSSKANIMVLIYSTVDDNTYESIIAFYSCWIMNIS